VAARTKARRRAAGLLFEAEQREVNPVVLVAERIETPVTEAPLPQYSADIVTGVSEHRARIDELLETYSDGWLLSRIPAVDRALLRVGAWEILYNDDVPDAVAVDEAVSLAGELSTDESPSFVNGLLDRLAQVKDSLLLD
jgi:N utilization substance protein B